MDTQEKLKILADSAKYDVSCSSSGSSRGSQKGKLGSTAADGICHTWSADGRCISLLKVLFTNKCVYDCQYCVNRRSVDCPRASFEPDELARLTIEFYKRNYIEGLFLSSAVEVSPDYTAERILHCLRLLRREYGFCGYIHAKIIPGVAPELVRELGMTADRLSVNIELPTQDSLELFAPQKKPKAIFAPMRQITNTLIEEGGLVAAGNMFKGQNINTAEHYIDNSRDLSAIQTAGGGTSKNGDNALAGGRGTNRGASESGSRGTGGGNATSLKTLPSSSFGMVPATERFSPADGSAALPAVSRRQKPKERFAPAGQTTQMIIGAGKETDRQILKTSEGLYRIFKMKRVYFSAYIPVSSSPLLPDKFTAPPLRREHRMYQADWLLRFYGFGADEILSEENPFLDLDLDPKIQWALRNIRHFPIEINKASEEELLRIPGVGPTSAKRIMRQRRVSAVKYDDLKKMGVVLKRAKYFLTCSGKYYGYDSGIREPEPAKLRIKALEYELELAGLSPDRIRQSILESDGGIQLSMFG